MAKAQTQTAVATVEETSGSLAVPDFMKGDFGAKDNFETSDLEIPRIKLISPIHKETEDGIRPGHFFHHIAEQDLGNKMTIVPIYVFKSYMLWRPRKDGGGLLARADDGIHWKPGNQSFDVKWDGKIPVTWTTKPTVEESGLHLWGSAVPTDQASQPAATKMINVVAYIEEFPDLSPVVIPLQRGHLKVGTRLVSMLKMGSVPCFGRRFEVTSDKTTNRDGEEYFVPKFRQIGFLQNQELYNEFKAMNDRMSKTTISVTGVDDLEDETPATGGAGANAPGDVDERV